MHDWSPTLCMHDQVQFVIEGDVCEWLHLEAVVKRSPGNDVPCLGLSWDFLRDKLAIKNQEVSQSSVPEFGS